MKTKQLLPLIVTDKLEQTKAYYVDKAGFMLTMDMDDYFQVRHGDDDGDPELCFMRATDASPIGPAAPFGGEGLIISIPTANADREHEQLRRRGAEIITEPSDKPWGWRSFFVRDPNGVTLDFFHVSTQSAVADATG